MDHPLETLIDRIVANSARRGELDNLPGAGKPLTDAHLGKDAVLNRLMTENQAKPQAVVLNEQIHKSRARLQILTAPDERKAEMKVLADLRMRYALELEATRKYG